MKPWTYRDSKKRASLRKNSKSERAKLVKELDDIVRQIIRLRDKVCQMSGATENLDVCHFISRAVYATRWDLDNLILATSGINRFWMPKYKTKYRDFMVRRIGEEKVMQLEWKERKPAPIYIWQLKLLKLDLLDKLKYYKKQEHK